ncbi:UNVERIFIED_ORG: hypothetical protein LHK14_27005 (plasmid) [Roseateles sp. XES5]|nr:hypothetical protein [Roseateles sp. XES5]
MRPTAQAGMAAVLGSRQTLAASMDDCFHRRFGQLQFDRIQMLIGPGMIIIPFENGAIRTPTTPPAIGAS